MSPPRRCNARDTSLNVNAPSFVPSVAAPVPTLGCWDVPPEPPLPTSSRVCSTSRGPASPSQQVQLAATSFEPSSTFVGVRAGFCFKLGEFGLGYYADVRRKKKDQENKLKFGGLPKKTKQMTEVGQSKPQSARGHGVGGGSRDAEARSGPGDSTASQVGRPSTWAQALFSQPADTIGPTGGKGGSGAAKGRGNGGRGAAKTWRGTSLGREKDLGRGDAHGDVHGRTQQAAASTPALGAGPRPGRGPDELSRPAMGGKLRIAEAAELNRGTQAGKGRGSARYAALADERSHDQGRGGNPSEASKGSATRKSASLRRDDRVRESGYRSAATAAVSSTSRVPPVAPMTGVWGDQAGLSTIRLAPEAPLQRRDAATTRFLEELDEAASMLREGPHPTPTPLPYPIPHPIPSALCRPTCCPPAPALPARSLPSSVVYPFCLVDFLTIADTWQWLPNLAGVNHAITCKAGHRGDTRSALGKPAQLATILDVGFRTEGKATKAVASPSATSSFAAAAATATTESPFPAAASAFITAPSDCSSSMIDFPELSTPSGRPAAVPSTTAVPAKQPRKASSLRATSPTRAPQLGAAAERAVPAPAHSFNFTAAGGTFVYQKPKPQANVLLSDLFDSLVLGKKVGFGAATDGRRLADSQNLSLTMSHRKVKENMLSSTGKAEPGVALIGMGRTQSRGKEKVGPKKVRMSSMKKTILRELMIRHGMLPGPGGMAAADRGTGRAVAAGSSSVATVCGGSSDVAVSEWCGVENQLCAKHGESGKAGGTDEEGEEEGEEQQKEQQLMEALVEVAFAQLYQEEAEEAMTVAEHVVLEDRMSKLKEVDAEELTREEEDELDCLFELKAGNISVAQMVESLPEGRRPAWEAEVASRCRHASSSSIQQSASEPELRGHAEMRAPVAPERVKPPPFTVAPPAVAVAVEQAEAAEAAAGVTESMEAAECGSQTVLIRPKEASTDPLLVREYALWQTLCAVQSAARPTLPSTSDVAGMYTRSSLPRWARRVPLSLRSSTGCRSVRISRTLSRLPAGSDTCVGYARCSFESACFLASRACRPPSS